MNFITKELGLCDYTEVWHEMKSFTASRTQDTPDEIWLLEHPPVFTQGVAGKPEHVLNPGTIPIVQTDRGGQITYHGPGQLVGYVLMDLRRAKIGVKQFVNLLETSVIQTLADYKIQAGTQDSAPGVYVNDTKICSIGLKISRGCSYHGIALNVNNDLTPFLCINPCGYKNLHMSKIADFCTNVPNIIDVGHKFAHYICTNAILKKV